MVYQVQSPKKKRHIHFNHQIVQEKMDISIRIEIISSFNLCYKNKIKCRLYAESLSNFFIQKFSIETSNSDTIPGFFGKYYRAKRKIIRSNTLVIVKI